MQSSDLQKPVNGHIQSGIDHAAYRLRSEPFPGEMTIAKDEAVGWFKRLIILIRLEEGASGEGD